MYIPNDCSSSEETNPESGCIVGGAAAAGRPESAGGVDEAAEHQLAGDERKQRDENFLQRTKLNGNKSKSKNNWKPNENFLQRRKVK